MLRKTKQYLIAMNAENTQLPVELIAKRLFEPYNPNHIKYWKHQQKIWRGTQ